MKIKIIGDHHGEESDKEFICKAEELARGDRIILILENKIAPDHKEDKIDKNIYAIEDEVIYRYQTIIRAVQNIFFIIKPLEEFGGKTLLQLYDQAPSENRTKILEDIANYMWPYLDLLTNIEEQNPIARILIGLWDDVVGKKCLGDRAAEILSQACKVAQNIKKSKRDCPTLEEIDLFRHNIILFNKILHLAALKFRDYILANNYSNEIKKHEGISMEWIQNYFEFKFLYEGHDILDGDKSIVDLRNQWFIERLNFLASKEKEKEIWFIVGEGHLQGLKELSNQYKHLNIEIILRNDKQELLFPVKKEQLRPILNSFFSAPPNTNNNATTALDQKQNADASSEKIVNIIFGYSLAL